MNFSVLRYLFIFPLLLVVQNGCSSMPSPSFEEADSQLLGAGEEDLEKLFFTCVDIPTTLNSNGSQIGNWSQSDIEKCKFEIINGMKSSGADETAVYAEFGISMDEISSCVCYKVEKYYMCYKVEIGQCLMRQIVCAIYRNCQ